MFQYTHDVVLNSLTMPDGTARVIAPVNDDGMNTKRAIWFHIQMISDSAVGYSIIYRSQIIHVLPVSLGEQN